MYTPAVVRAHDGLCEPGFGTPSLFLVDCASIILTVMGIDEALKDRLGGTIDESRSSTRRSMALADRAPLYISSTSLL